ncbi:MAG: flagellar hook capping FlgD N-terminal domain-containing protein [Betaproteobacteria bacterium]|jgi:flagellar basal-body rod modification protein FlgD
MSALSAVPSVTDLAAASGGSKSSIATSNEESGDRFLKLLVTQLKNQDPMNPMDNAQLTTQMAQINTVAGIEKLNTAVGSMTDKLSTQLAGLNPSGGLDKLETALQKMSGQFLQSQTLQGAGMVGRQVWTAGSALAVESGKGVGAFELAGPADAVSVDVLSPAGRVVGQVDLGAQASGRRAFQWPVPEGMDPSGLTFRVNARAGADAVRASPQSADRVSAVTAGPDGLVLQLSRSGPTPVNNVKAWS